MSKKFNHVVQSPVFGGALLFAAAVAAFIWANLSPETYNNFWLSPLNINLGSHGDSSVLSFSFMNFQIIVNDLIMAVFFLYVGMEIKREIIAGKLSAFKTAILPVVAALGGMLVPAFIYFMFGHHDIAANGWGIPMATDIAFSLAVISLLSNKVPLSLKIFLMALAVVDDMGAIVVIAVFYTEHLAPVSLLIGLGGVAFLYFCNKVLKIRNLSFYHAFCIIIIWSQFLNSGVHATLVGILLAFVLPCDPKIKPAEFIAENEKLLVKLKNADQSIQNGVIAEQSEEVLAKVSSLSHEASNPMQRFEHRLAPAVSLIIMPLFALANAGVNISGTGMSFFEAISSPVALGVGLGLLFGKPIGIFLFTFLAAKLGLGRLNPDVTWRHILGMGMIAGMGFTMSIFVTELAFRTQNPDLTASAASYNSEAKLAILVASILAALTGFCFLYFGGRKKQKKTL